MADYLTPAQLKSTLSITETFADADIQQACTAASRAVDGYCGRFFYPGPAGEVRKYTPVASDYLQIDDALTVVSVVSAGTTLVADTDYMTNGPPGWGVITELRMLNGIGFPRNQALGVVVTGNFGWTTAPPEVVQATTLVAARLLRRAREAVFGVVGIGFDGAAVTVGSTDPDVRMLLAPYKKSGLDE